MRTFTIAILVVVFLVLALGSAQAEYTALKEATGNIIGGASASGNPICKVPQYRLCESLNVIVRMKDFSSFGNYSSTDIRTWIKGDVIAGLNGLGLQRNVMVADTSAATSPEGFADLEIVAKIGSGRNTRRDSSSGRQSYGNRDGNWSSSQVESGSSATLVNKMSVQATLWMVDQAKARDQAEVRHVIATAEVHLSQSDLQALREASSRGYSVSSRNGNWLNHGPYRASGNNRSESGFDNDRRVMEDDARDLQSTTAGQQIAGQILNGILVSMQASGAAISYPSGN